MKYLGIDFGAKKVGVSISDENGQIAFPKETVPNDERLMQYLREVVACEQVGAVVIGDTRAASGAANDVTAALERFAKTLGNAVSIPIHIVPEYGTSAAARASNFEGVPRGDIQSPHSTTDEGGVDARAAALILQRFLDQHPDRAQ